MGLDIGGAARPNASERAAGIDAIPSGRSHYWPIANHDARSKGDALRAAFEMSRHATLVADPMGRIELANPAATTLLQRSRAELEGSALLDWLSPEEGQSALSIGESPTPRSCNVRLRDGRRVRAWQRALCDRWGSASQLCIELEEVVEPASVSLAPIAHLAGVLSHDMSNQLAVALNYIAVLERRTRRVPELGAHLAELQGTLWRTARLADELKLLARRPDPEAKPLRLDRIARQLLPLLRHITGAASIEVASERGIPKIEAPLGHVEQLFCSIALSAMRRAGVSQASLVLRLLTMEDCESNERIVRVGCEVKLLAAPTQAPRGCTRPLTRPPHSERLRQAVRACRARLHHDSSSIYVDFPVCR